MADDTGIGWWERMVGQSLSFSASGEIMTPMMEIAKCIRCDVPLPSLSLYCIACYRALCQRCTRCHRGTTRGKKVWKDTRTGAVIDVCPDCNNERWVMRDR